jgi:hypothetical protein
MSYLGGNKKYMLHLWAEQCIFWPIFVRFRVKLKIKLFKKTIGIPIVESPRDQGYDHVQAYLGICQKKIYVKKIYVKKSRAQFLHFVYFSHVTSILGFTKLSK